MDKALKFIKKNKAFTFAAVLVLLITGVAVCAPLLATHDPYEAVLADAIQAPSAQHWFGTDGMGRDLYSRVLYGARTSLLSALALVAIITVVGTTLGIVAGYFGGIVDAVVMRLADMMISFPGMVLAIAVAGILGANMTNAIIAISLVTWPKYARLSRSLVLKIRNRDYVAAAQVTGSKTPYILLKYMLPNALPTILITAATDIGSMMLEIAALSFLGFGAQSPTAEWGLMLNEGRAYMVAAPWLMLFPGCAIFITVVAFNLLGDSLRDVLDPRSDSAVSRKSRKSRKSKERNGTKEARKHEEEKRGGSARRRDAGRVPGAAFGSLRRGWQQLG